MNNGKMFDLPPKCPGMLTTKLTGLFGWRHTYRVSHRQKGIDHHSQQNLHKTYSLNLSPKKLHETSASNPSLLEATSTVKLLLRALEIPQVYLCLSPDESSVCGLCVAAEYHKKAFTIFVLASVYALINHQPSRLRLMEISKTCKAVATTRNQLNRNTLSNASDRRCILCFPHC